MMTSKNVNFDGRGIEPDHDLDAIFGEGFSVQAEIPDITTLTVNGLDVGHIIRDTGLAGTQFIISAVLKVPNFEGSKHMRSTHFAYETAVSTNDKQVIEYYSEALEEAQNVLGVDINEEA